MKLLSFPRLMIIHRLVIARLVLCLALSWLPRIAEAAPDLAASISALELQWAKISYQSTGIDQDAAFLDLLRQVDVIAREFPGQPLPMAWRGIILCSHAEVAGGLGSLREVTEARDLFLEAKRLDPRIMDGTVDGYLGTLYHRVPGWPVGFGDRQRAVFYFQQAMAENPAGIDANYMYGLYLLDQGDRVAGRAHLMAALHAPIRPDHADYDAGRRQDIQSALDGAK